MNECQKRGHRRLFTTCEECNQVIDLKTFKAPDGWISVKDRLPDIQIDVITWCISNGGENTMFEKYEGYAAIERRIEGGSFRTDLFFNAKVTHWIPLPSPPKEPPK